MSAVKRMTLSPLDMIIHSPTVYSWSRNENFKNRVLLFSALCWLSNIVLIPTFSRTAVCYISAHFSAFTLELTAEDRLIGAARCSVMLQWAGVSFHTMSCFVSWHLWVLITGRLFCCWLQEFGKHSAVALFCFECINILHMIMLSTGKGCFINILILCACICLRMCIMEPILAIGMHGTKMHFCRK